ncbi:MAG: DNA repair protein RecO C-terminal domain-containing protein, partial [Phycisphaeraceae bacterium]|nr:DNA repair protein RecO C-terminal domain-containing protein [Phycisphaeraceae bacterium]
GAVARFSGGFELLTAGEVVATTKSTAELATVTEWDLQRPHHHLRTDWAAQQTAYYAADLVNHLIGDEDPHPQVYKAMSRLLVAIESPTRRPGELLLFQWRLLEDAGYRPDLDRDARAGGDLPEKADLIFDPRAGGLSVAEGGWAGDSSTSGPWRVRAETVDQLKQVRSGEAPAGDAEAIDRANRLLCVYVRAILDRELMTMRWLLGEEG